MHLPDETFTDLPLDADKRVVAARTLREMRLGLTTLEQSLERDGLLPAQLAKSVLCVCEYRIAELGAMAGVSTQSAADLEARHAALREANERIRELEAQVGAQTGAGPLASALKRYADHIEAWWELEGMGYVRHVSFNRWGHLELELSCTPSGGFLLVNSPTPVSDAEAKVRWLASLAERGFELIEEPSADDCAIRDCDASRETMLALFGRRLPSSVVQEFTQHRHRKGGFALRSVKLFVRNLADLDTLPEEGGDSDPS